LKKKAFAFLLIYCLAGIGLQAQGDFTERIILQAAELSISGSTNVNSFNCSLKKINMSDTLAISKWLKTEPNALNGLEIVFRVEDFTCDLALMTNDFRRLLKNDQHPFIKMKIDKLMYEDTDALHPSGKVSASVTLSIAGENGRELIRKASVHKIKQKIIFTGSHEVLMTKFHIEPPTKMFGAVKTKDLLVIDFAIQLQ
jgi:hypothetical protein